MSDEKTRQQDKEVVKLANARRAAAIKAQKQREIKNKETKAKYQRARNHPVIQDIIQHGVMLATMHNANARNRVSAEADGTIIRLSGEDRLAEIDRAAGIMELVNYIQRQITPEPKVKTTKAETTPE